MISIVQNFICTQPARLKLIEREIGKMAEVFQDYPFYINYNTTENYEEVKSLYENNVKNLTFNNDLTRDWSKVTLDLVNLVQTEYLIVLCEDFEYRIDYEGWKKIEAEIVENNVKYMPIGRLWKYTTQEYHGGYTEGDKLWFYKAKDSPGSSLSTDAFYETHLFKMKLLEVPFHENEGYRFPKHLPHHYEETFWEEKNNAVRILGEMMCAIPKDIILMHEQEQTETTLNK